MKEITSVEHLRTIIRDYGPRGAAKIRDHICEQGIAFIKRSPFLILGTRGDYGLELSPKGGDPGFVEIVDNRTILIPEYVGNHLAIGLTNIIDNSQVSVMLIRPATDEVLRISGKAVLIDDAELCASVRAGGKPALLVIKLAVERAAFHCVRSARRAGLWDPGSWDQPTRISFGRIYAEALGDAALEEQFEKFAEESDKTLY